MLKKFALAAAAASTALVAMPTAAQAQSGYYSRDGYNRYYRGDRYDRGDRYGNRYGNGRYARNNGYYGRNYDNRYYGNRRCEGSGTTGAIVGGVAGALLGREATRDTRGYNRNSGTTGAIIGGALGALAGRAIDKGGDCR